MSFSLRYSRITDRLNSPSKYSKAQSVKGIFRHDFWYDLSYLKSYLKSCKKLLKNEVKYDFGGFCTVSWYDLRYDS